VSELWPLYLVFPVENFTLPSCVGPGQARSQWPSGWAGQFFFSWELSSYSRVSRTYGTINKAPVRTFPVTRHDKSGLENLFSQLAIESSATMCLNLTFDLAFPHSYTVVPAELSRNGEHPPIYFPGGTRTIGKDGLLLRFTASDGDQ